MIFDKMENFSKYVSISEGFKDVYEFMQKNDLLALPVGKAPISDNAYLNRQQYVGKEEVDNRYESHNDYADVQIVLKGEEKNNYSFKCPDPAEINAKDCYFTEAEKDVVLTLKPDNFVIYFPKELHKPCLKTSDEVIEKIVFKVKIK